MKGDAADLSGRWDGEYSYPDHLGPVTPFVATIVDHSGHLSGSIMEPNTVAAGMLEARIAGARNGVGVDFTKTYGPGGHSDYANPVDYVGTISGDGNLIRGRWSILEIDGTFEMRRDLEVQKVSDVEAEVSA